MVLLKFKNEIKKIAKNGTIWKANGVFLLYIFHKKVENKHRYEFENF
jgi:hypothetical protein